MKARPAYLQAFLLITQLLIMSTVSVPMPIPRRGIRPPGHPLCASQLALVRNACTNLPLRPMPPPPYGPNQRMHRRRYRRRRRHRTTSQEVECCRWLKEVDSQCICDMLVSLPTFLSRPNHIYTVVVGDTCSVTYATCTGTGSVTRPMNQQPSISQP